MLQNLCAPARVGPGVEPFPKLKAHAPPEAHQVAKAFPRRAVSVMVVVGPAEAQCLLLRELPAGGGVAGRVIDPLGGEKLFHRAV